MKERARCPACREQGVKSEIARVTPMATTMMPVRRFYDREGRLHVHDPNPGAMIGRCSEGHEVVITESNECRVESCEFGSPAEVKNPDGGDP